MKVMFDYQIFFLQEYGGVSRYFIELYTALEKCEDIEINIYAKYFINEYLANCNKVNKQSYSTNKLLRKIKRGKEVIINQHICRIASRANDVVHITWTNPFLNGVAKDKLVVTIHDMIHEIYWGHKEEFKREILNKRKAIYDSKAIIAISENTKNDIIKFYPDIPPQKIKVIYHGTNHLPYPQKPNIELPESFLLYVGARSDYKGAKFFLEAIAETIKIYNISVIFVGGGKFDYEEQSYIDSLKISEFVIQTNVTDSELAYLYSKAICFVYPSLYEGFGFPILEAFDNGCPVVCTNSSSLPEVGGDAAVYFDEGDKKSLVESIIRIIRDKEFRSLCVNKGRERVNQFSWDKCAEETLKLYKDIITGKFDV